MRDVAVLIIDTPEAVGILNGPTSNAASENLLNTVSFGSNVSATWANILKFESQIQTQNADLGTMQWLTNPTVRNAWKQIAKIGNTFPVFLFNDDGACFSVLLGYKEMDGANEADIEAARHRNDAKREGGE